MCPLNRDPFANKFKISRGTSVNTLKVIYMGHLNQKKDQKPVIRVGKEIKDFN